MKPTKHDLHKVSLWRRLTAPVRALPDYIILGAQKAGTTTLYDNLVKHPQVIPADIKEVHFFDNRYKRGVNWYRAHFPSKSAMRLMAGSKTGEGSPYYLFHPLVPERVKALTPNAKLLVVLRNPIDRAYSHYQHEARKEREPLSFEDAIAAEETRTGGDFQLLSNPNNDGNYDSDKLQHFSYVSRGRYAEQLERWFAVFPREQFLIVTSDELNREFGNTMGQVFRFLGLAEFPIERPKRSNVGSYDKMKPETRAQLVELFRPDNARLEDMLGRKLYWDQ